MTGEPLFWSIDMHEDLTTVIFTGILEERETTADSSVKSAE